MTLIFNKKSWHYRLILYSFGKNFFTDAQIDWRATEESFDADKKEELKFVYKYTTKTVNLCPYCRALVGATITIPFLYLWRLLPHKEKKEMTREQIKKASHRRSWIARGIGGGINISLGIKNILDFTEGGYITGIIQIAIGVTLLTIHIWGTYFLKGYLRLSRLVPKRKPQEKKEPKQHKPSHIVLKIQEKHDVICPPIFFVDVKNNSELR